MLLYFQIIMLCSLALSGWAEVDTSRPDLSVYKLRRVDTRQLALERAHNPIVELENGAEHMRESLYTSSRQVRCPAYAHLFRLIKSANGLNRCIQQATVEALAVVVTNEYLFYFNLLTRQPDYLLTASNHFMEAAEGLERRQLSEADAYLDLMNCLSDNMFQSLPEVRQFLDQPLRARRLAQVTQFKAIPAGGGATPEGMVGGLRDRIEEGRAAKLSATEFLQAQELIENLDDQLVATFRQTNKLERKPMEEAEESASEGRGQLSSTAPPIPLDLVVPTEQPKGSATTNSFDASRLAILKFIKMRLEQPSWSRMHKPVRLSMKLAFDFHAHWQDLVAYKPLSCCSNKLDQFSVTFRDDVTNVQLARRIDRAITTYEELVKVLDTMQDEHLESLEELKRPLAKLGDLLATMDAAFDVDDIRRLNKIWRSKFQEYSIMDKFINRDFW